jgi:hypothetical protein
MVYVAKRAVRKGRNPATGAAIKIAASKSPKFSAGATLKSAVETEMRTKMGIMKISALLLSVALGGCGVDGGSVPCRVGRDQDGARCWTRRCITNRCMRGCD